MSLTEEDGREYAGQQEAAPRAPSATDPMSVKLADVATRNAILFNVDDLSVINASVVELQAYESLLVAPPPGMPVIIDVPYLSQSGDQLSCTMGNWENEPSSYAYQWQLDGADAGTDAATYDVTVDDAGKTATCVVTATNAVGSTTAPVSNSVVVEAPPVAAREA